MYTVAGSFDKFASNIEVTGYSRDVAKGRENNIKTLLGSKFEILDIFSIGSLPKYTAVKHHADLDIMVVLHWGKHVKDRKPSNVLLSIKNALDEDAVSVRRNGQAVSLGFKTWPNVDIVPVSRVTNSDGSVNYYEVPNMNTETWLKSRPRSHASKMTDKNDDNVCGARFKRAVKMAKWWNFQNGSLLSSYHIEILALNSLYTYIDAYPWHIYWLFKNIQEKAHQNTYDGLSYISSDLTTTQKALFDTRIANAVRRLDEADTFVREGKDKDAIEKYRMVFGDQFPAYG